MSEKVCVPLSEVERLRSLVMEALGVIDRYHDWSDELSEDPDYAVDRIEECLAGMLVILDSWLGKLRP